MADGSLFAVTPDTLDPRALEAAVRSDACGAVVTFAGVVRDRSDDGAAVVELAYEAFEPLAVAEFERIAAEARERFGDGLRIAMQHRVGALKVGEIAVVVAVAAPHRAEAFAACAYAIDELKRRAPIWKQERLADGRAHWRENACS